MQFFAQAITVLQTLEMCIRDSIYTLPLLWTGSRAMQTVHSDRIIR